MNSGVVGRPETSVDDRAEKNDAGPLRHRNTGEDETANAQHGQHSESCVRKAGVC